MRQFAFYVSYALRSIRRGGRWTALAIFCIAAGVATVVALRSLGLAIADSLVSNVREDNKGDVRLVKRNQGAGDFAAALTYGDDAPSFSDEEIATVRGIVTDQGAQISPFATGGNLQIAPVNGVSTGRPQFAGTFLIEPETYPPSHDIVAIEPAGVPLADLFTGGREVVISSNMAEQLGIGIGDQVRVGGSETPFDIVGIVDAQEEAGVRNLFSSFFGFAYIDIEAIQTFIDADIRPNQIAIAYPEPLTEDEANDVLNTLISRTSREGSLTRGDTAPSLLERNQTISQVLGDFIVVMGLGALLIGGVGIMNTMLVMVRRRTTEIASLKTFGLKGRQIGMLFFTEALTLGVIGSVLGGVLGFFAGGIVNQYGEAFLQQRLAWKLYPEALLYGFVLGMVITAIFGTAPILTALQVRPGIILRPNESYAPRLGILQTLGLMIFVVLAIGLIVGQIISPSLGLASSFVTTSPYVVGIISVTFVLMFLGFLVLVLWVLVWIIGKFPSFGNVDLRLALRNLSNNRLRTATTLLALSAGMFALSAITFIGQGTRELLNLQLSSQFGGNVLAFPLAPGGLSGVGELAINNALANVPVTYRTTIASYDPDLIDIDGTPIEISGDFEPGEGDFDPFDPATIAPFIWNSLSEWDSDNPNIYENLSTAVEGRNLTLEDRGQPYITGPKEYADPLGIQVGSILTYEINNRQYQLEVIGLTASANSSGFGNERGGSVLVAPEVIAASPPFRVYSYQVEPEYVNEALTQLGAIRIPPTLALDVTFIDGLLARLIDQFAAIPTVVGLLSLFAAAVIMANTVALATLERRRQIGILKSVGLKSRRVLVIMLIETTLIGLLSAVLGLGLSSIFVTLLTGFGGTPIPLPADARLTAVALVVAAVVIGWLATFISANVAVRERVMNVLRYE